MSATDNRQRENDNPTPAHQHYSTKLTNSIFTDQSTSQHLKLN
jgi:hypothetical protein